MKTTLILMLTGALLGATVASYVVPPALSWYTAPGGLPQGAQIQAVVQIPEVIRYATSRLIRGQLVGAAIGATVGLVLAIVLAVKNRSLRRATQLPSAPTSTPTSYTNKASDPSGSSFGRPCNVGWRGLDSIEPGAP